MLGPFKDLSLLLMVYKSLFECISELEKAGLLKRVTEEVSADLEMAAIHLRVHEKGGPALLFENIKGCRYQAASNIFGTLERSKFIFRKHFDDIQKLVELKNDPVKALKQPLKYAGLALLARKSMPKNRSASISNHFQEISIGELPLIRHWPKDGGAFVTLPQVYSEDVDRPGVMHSNLGMYRIQLNGNQYSPNKEIGLHYQLHRGIGIHQTKANGKNIPLKVSIFVGGPPSHTLAAVMPLPEGISELTFAGALGGRRFNYTYHEGYCISVDADFVITGEVHPHENKPEGPFGDHLGYYSLTHDFPVMRVHKVLAKKQNAIWPFTVVGRPPQEDTQFGALIHELTGQALKHEIPGLKEINAVDAAGVHPLLLAAGSERYTPYLNDKRPAELLTIANRILGTGQLSLAKYLFITAGNGDEVSVNKVPEFLAYCLKRIDFRRDLHFHTQTSIDTLDYSGTGLNSGSKVVFAAYGDSIRKLSTQPPAGLDQVKMVMPGIMAFAMDEFENYEKAKEEFGMLERKLKDFDLQGIPLIIACNDAGFVSAGLNNFLWTTFTRSNPSHDIYGVGAFTENKHWGCRGSLIIDARAKPHHAPALEKDAQVENKIDRIFAKGGSLYGLD